MQKFKVILADDHSIVRTGLRNELAESGNVEVVGEASNGAELLQLLSERWCNLVVLDLAMPEMNGLTALTEIRERYPEVICVVLSGFPDYAGEARRLGASGYLLKTESTERIADAVRSLLAGGAPVFSNALGREHAENHELGEAVSPVTTPGLLSKRERQILTLVARGLKHAEIAAQLNVVERTVEFHKSNIKAKLKLNTNAELVRYAVQHGLT